jgi:hypothetical protein
MKKTSGITSVESNAGFPERMLEKFVQDNLPTREIREDKISGMGDFSYRYREIESCAAETPVNGTIEIFFETSNPFALKRLSVTVSTRFFVFCARDNGEHYKIACSCSLS